MWQQNKMLLFFPLGYAVSPQKAMVCAFASRLSNWKIHFLLWQGTWSRALLPQEKKYCFQSNEIA